MGVSGECWEEHQQIWSRKLVNYRKIWPSRLFRHEPIENAIKIISSGKLLSRSHAENVIQNDIAPAEIIQCNDQAHNYVRLYFRPRNPTQFHIEGIRKVDEYYQGKHAGLLTMFVFSAGGILTDGSTKFSDGNMQSFDSAILDGDEAFAELDFEKIYHDSAHSGDHSITRARCAEVLAPSPLVLSDHLEYILVRSDAERNTLVHKLRMAGSEQYAPKVRVAVRTGIYFSHFTCVDYVDTNGDEIIFQIRPRRNGGLVHSKLELYDGAGVLVLGGREREIDPTTKWRWRPQVAGGNYVFRILLEGVPAFEGPVKLS